MAGKAITIETRPGSLTDGRLVYRAADHAFAFETKNLGRTVHSPQGTASLLVGTIQVAVETNSGRLLLAWGYSPVPGWRRAAITDLHQKRGAAFMDASDLLPGVGISVVEAHDALSVVDKDRQAVRISNGVPPDSVFTIARGVSLLLAGTKLVGVQLSPINFDEITGLRSSRNTSDGEST